jgi:hypothetical protein
VEGLTLLQGVAILMNYTLGLQIRSKNLKKIRTGGRDISIHVPTLINYIDLDSTKPGSKCDLNRA